MDDNDVVERLSRRDLYDAHARGNHGARRRRADCAVQGVGGDGDFFRLPFYTIESVHLVDARTLVIASDNNLPFSNGRARSRASDRKEPLAADDTELVLVRLGTPLDADPRLLPSPARAGSR